MLRTDILEKKINKFMEILKEEKELKGWNCEIEHNKDEHIFRNKGIVLFLDSETEEEEKGRLLDIEIIVTQLKSKNKFDFRRKIELIENIFDEITNLTNFRIEKKTLNYSEFESKTTIYIDTASIQMTLDISSITDCFDEY